MKTLDQLPNLLAEMVSAQKEKPAKTFVARYNGKNLIMRSGKSSWKAVNHTKAAVLQHFSRQEDNYAYNSNSEQRWNVSDGREAESRREQFRAKLWELIEIVELS